jgi:hypothetical protein
MTMTKNELVGFMSALASCLWGVLVVGIITAIVLWFTSLGFANNPSESSLKTFCGGVTPEQAKYGFYLGAQAIRVVLFVCFLNAVGATLIARKVKKGR